MAPLLNVGTAWRGSTGVPQRFSLRAYVPREDLESPYGAQVNNAVSPAVGEDTQLAEQLGRLATQEQGPLPPAHEPLWTLPLSMAPAVHTGNLPLYHPPQRLRRSLEAVTSEQRQMAEPLITMLLDQDEIHERRSSIRKERNTRNYTRESDWTVPVAWFALFAPEDHAPVDQDGQIRHRLVAPADMALARVSWGARVLEDSQEEDFQELGEDLRTVARWVSTFSAMSMIVLDYGTVAHSIQPDDSPRDLRDAISSVNEHDHLGAEVAMGRLMKRWMPLAHLEFAS